MSNIDYPETSTTQSVRVDFVCLPAINFALQQNHVPFIRQLIFHNDSLTEYNNVVIEIISEPEFTVAWSQTVSVIGPGESFEIKNSPLKVLST